MSKPVIFTISPVWDGDASVWSGHCDEIPAAADAPTLDALLAKIAAMALDLLPTTIPMSIPPRYSLRSLRCVKQSPRRPDGASIRPRSAGFVASGWLFFRALRQRAPRNLV
jgi:Domain of unknown function (DUF1902)